MDTNPPTKAEVLKAIMTLKTEKDAEFDGIPAEELKMGPEILGGIYKTTTGEGVKRGPRAC